MNKFKLYFLVISVGLVLFSCSKDEEAAPVPLRDYATQFAADNTAIETYLKSTYIEVVDHQGFSDDKDVTLTKIPAEGTQKSIWSYIPTADSDPNSYPKLLSKNVVLHDITYKIYYLKLRADNDNGGKSPCQVDAVLASYRGYYLYNNSTTFFQALEFPQRTLGLDETVRGWSEIFPLFKSGNYDENANPENPSIFQNFGAGVIFIPSGLGYYNFVSGSIPSYSPLIFSFKLYDVTHTDQDGDGILSKDEDVNNDGDLTNDDTDGDGVYNVFDIDDDGDGKLTKNEIKNAAGDNYSFETIPDCSGNTTDGLRTKRHLDKNCYKD